MGRDQTKNCIGMFKARSRLCEGEVIEGILSMNLPPERDLVNSKADLLFLLLQHGIIFFYIFPKIKPMRKIYETVWYDLYDRLIRKALTYWLILCFLTRKMGFTVFPSSLSERVQRCDEILVPPLVHHEPVRVQVCSAHRFKVTTESVVCPFTLARSLSHKTSMNRISFSPAVELSIILKRP